MLQDFLKLEDIAYTYQAKNGEVEALKNINFSVNRGELVSIVGPSGCGKSTLLSLIAGLICPNKGKIELEGQSVQKVKTEIAYMQQTDNLLEWRNIKKNLLLGLEIQKKKTKESVAYVDKLMETYGLADFKNSYPSQLSGGMRQRAALIRTLAIRPSLLLLDEAFSALDFQTRLQVTNDVRDILLKEGKTTIMVTHDIPEAISMSDRIIVLSSRPADVRTVRSMEFDGCISPLKRRSHPKFSSYFNEIWGELVEQ